MKIKKIELSFVKKQKTNKNMVNPTGTVGFYIEGVVP